MYCEGHATFSVYCYTKCTQISSFHNVSSMLINLILILQGGVHAKYAWKIGHVLHAIDIHTMPKSRSRLQLE